MTITLHYHPLSSYCWKTLIALYELDVPFERVLVDFGDPASAAAFRAIAPLGKFPVIEDDGRVVVESSIIIEYLDRRQQLIPAGREVALRVRALDRFFDNHIHAHMQRIVADRIRPEGAKDPQGVADARAALATAYAVAEHDLPADGWAAGDSFTLADCAAAPALWYGNRVAPIGDGHPSLIVYLDRLTARPSFARTLEEAGPYLHMFPG